jgi:iron complex outermembrane receptor protein
VQGYVARQSSTASKTGASILETPQSVTVIGRDELTDRGVQTITQAVGYTPGIFAATTAVSQRFDYFTIRGFDATNTGTILDGLRSTTNQSYVRYQPYGMERVEVLRGPASVLYGGNSLGGVVNMISKRPTDQPIREIGLQFGSYDRIQAQVDLSGPLNQDKTLLYRLVGVGRKSDTQFDGVPDDTGYIAPSFTWRPNADTSLTVLTSFSRDKFGPPRPFLPIYGTLLPNPNGKIPWNQYLDGKNLDNTNEQINLGYVFDHRISNVWSVHSASRFTYNDLFTQTLSGMGLAPNMRTLLRSAYQFNIKGKVFATDNNAKAEWRLGDVQGTSVFGLAYRRTAEDYYLNFGSAPSIDIYNPTYGANFAAPTPFTSTLQNGREVALYNVNTIKVLDRIVFDIGGRQDWSSIDTDNRLKNSTTSQDDRAFTYRLGATYLTDFGAAPYVSYATSFSPVLGTDFYGQPFKPTTGKQYEIGVKYQPKGLDALFTLAWFHLVQQNVSTTDPANPLNTIQTGEVTSEGVELSAAVNITRSFKLIASYTYNSVEVTKTTNPVALGRTQTGVPEQMASVWGDYTIEAGPLAGVGFGAGVRYLGSRYADPANTISVPAVALIDAAIRYDLGKLSPQLKGFNLAVNATNLFNKHYYSTCSSTSCNQGYGQSVLGTISYRW